MPVVFNFFQNYFFSATSVFLSKLDQISPLFIDQFPKSGNCNTLYHHQIDLKKTTITKIIHNFSKIGILQCFSSRRTIFIEYRFPSFFAGVTFHRNLKSANTKTIPLCIKQVKTVFFPLLFAVFPCFLVREQSKPYSSLKVGDKSLQKVV